MKELKVAKIENGTVIDHIAVGKSFECLKIISPSKEDTIIMGVSVYSSKNGKKDIIKIENFFPDEKTIGKIALVSPGCTINTIKNAEVIKKYKPEIPERIEELTCINPKCVSKNDLKIGGNFIVESKDPIILRCNYCDRLLNEKEIHKQFSVRL